MTLPWEEDRPLLFASSALTLQDLHREFAVSEKRLPASLDPERPPGLAALERFLFRSGSCADPAGVALLSAPNPYAEVEAAVRWLRRVADSGVPWGECLVIARTPAEYGPTLASVCERLEVPLATLQPGKLLDRWPAAALRLLLRVFRFGWRRDDVLGYLRTVCEGDVRLEVESLGRRARRLGVREGRPEWESRLLGDMNPGSWCADRLAALAAWDRRLLSIRRSMRQHAEQLQALARAEGIGASQEHASAHRALSIATELAEASSLLNPGPVALAEFADEVLPAWESSSCPPDPADDQVLLVEPYDSRVRHCRAAVVLGLAERSFPRRAVEDPFFRDDERALLRQAGVALESRLERAQEERLLFYLAVTAPSEQLLLAHSRSSDESDTLRSFYLDDVEQVLPALPRLWRGLSDVAPGPDEAATDHDRLLAACEAVRARMEEDRQAGGSGESPDVARLASELGHEVLASDAETARSNLLPPLPRLTVPEARRMYHRRRRWNVSELEMYLTCPFQFFVHHCLGVGPEDDGAGPAHRGRLYHQVLHRAFRRRRNRQAGPSLRDDLIAELRKALAEHRTDAPRHRRAILERFLQDALEGFVQREELFAPAFGCAPAHLELAFGLDPQRSAERECDPASTPQPLRLEDPDAGEPVLLCGVIDRVDRMDDGAALVMDYKTGTPPKPGDILKGDRLQMPLYMLALEQLWGLRAVAAVYDSPRDRGRRRIFDCELLERFRPIEDSEDSSHVKPITPDQRREMTHAARYAAVRAAARIADLDILPTPGDHCRTCACAACCRTTLQAVHDGEPFRLEQEE